MLVITRRNEERILIGPDIEVVIFGCGHKYCRVGIDAPPGVKILRKELAGRDELRVASGEKGGGDGSA